MKVDLLIAVLIAVLPSCDTEDSASCYWNAAEHGNGEGTSFIDLEGDVFYIVTEGDNSTLTTAPPCTDSIADTGGICHGEP